MTSPVLVLLGLLAWQADATGPQSNDSRLVIEQFAASPEIVTPTGIAVDSKGRVLVIESHTHFRPEGYKGPSADRIRLLEDTNADGIADRFSTFFEGTKFTMGLAFHPDGALFVATRYEIFRLRDADQDGRADRPPERLAKLETAGNYPHNGLSGFAFDPEGRVVFGLGENLGASYKLVGRDGASLSGGGEGGNVYRIKPDGSSLERIATGFWNPFHQAFDTFGRLFIVDNDPDSRPPCRLIHVVPNGDYGYRFRNGRKGLHPFTAWNGELPGTLPMTAGTGEAPSGLLSYESDNLPADYIGSILATSWGDHSIERFRLKPQGASFKSVAEPLVVGGENFRPVGIVKAHDGSLYISDWVDKSYSLHGQGRVWHLRAKSAPQRRLPESDDLALSRPDRTLREASAHRLTITPEGRLSLLSILKQSAQPRARAAALNALVNHDNTDPSAYRVALTDPSEDLRALAVRRLPLPPVSIAKVAANDASPLVRAEALRRITSSDDLPTLLKSLDDPDPFTLQATRQGMKAALPQKLLLSLLHSDKPTVRLNALLVLRDLNANPDPIIPNALKDLDPSIRFVAVAWIGESKLEQFRDTLRNGLATSATTRHLFEAYLAALERLEAPPRGYRDEQPGEEYIASLLKDPKTLSSLLARSLRMIRPDHPALTSRLLKSFLTSTDPLLATEAVRTLRETNHPDRYSVLSSLATNPETPPSLRAEAILGLAPAAQAHRPLLLLLAAQDDKLVRYEALRSLRNLPLSPLDSSLASKFAKQDPETASLLAPLKPLPTEPLEAWLAKLEGPADPEAGARIFFHSKGPGCYRCHQVEGRGGRAGPDLSTTAATLTRQRLIESIIEPSKEIAPQFTPWLVARKDGTVFTGALLDQSASGTQTYANDKGEIIIIDASEIEDRRPQTTSIMPANLPALMTTQEFRNLLAYLQQKHTD